MAKVKVIKGDTLTQISVKKNVSTEVLKALNPGVKTVKAGQVIKVPKYDEDTPAPNLGGGMTPTPPVTIRNPQAVRPTITPAVNTPYTGTAGYSGAFNQPNVQAGGMLSPDKNPVVRQTYLGSSGYLNPTYQTPQNTQPSNVPTAPTVKLTNPRPVNPDGSTPFFTGDPNDPNTAAWRAYWKNVAQLGGDPNIPAAAPTVMTREEIWQMKAASRRRKMQGMSSDELAGSGGGYSPYQYSEQTQSYIPETLVRSITWGI